MNRILLVDDLEFIKIITRKTLEEGGYEICGDASDGQEAIDKYMELSPDLVVLDITMPKMDGLQALKIIIENDPKAKVIICSAIGNEKVIVDAIKIGAKDFVIKPFSPKRILSAIECALN